MNYVAFYVRGSREIYGVAVCEHATEVERLLEFCRKNHVRFTTGFTHTPEELIRAAETNLCAVGKPTMPHWS